MHSRKNWLQTRAELEEELARWKITDYTLTKPDNTQVTLRYVLRGNEITLTMGKQWRAADNLRIIFLTVQALRMNEVRGMTEIFASAYAQLNAPVIEKDPYDVLGLPRGTAKAVCEAQYRELLKKYHPDVQGGSAEKTKELIDAINKVRTL